MSTAGIYSNFEQAGAIDDRARHTVPAPLIGILYTVYFNPFYEYSQYFVYGVYLELVRRYVRYKITKMVDMDHFACYAPAADDRFGNIEYDRSSDDVSHDGSIPF